MEYFIGEILNVKNKQTGEILKVRVKNIIDNKPVFENFEATKHKVNLIVDSRENINFKKEIFEDSNINFTSKRLDVSDILIDNYLAIERKTPKDFVNSLLDKRLFSQLKELALNFKRPLLIIEGEESLFIQRNLSPNIILSSLISIQVDFRIPIIFTKDSKETIEYIKLIIKRREKLNKNLSVNVVKQTKSNRENLENFIGTIPKLNKTSAKKLLTKFKTIKDLVNSQIKDLEECEGIGKIRAKYLYEFFRENYFSS